MKDLRVLYLGKNDQYRINQEIRWIREELKKLCHVDEYGIGSPHPELDATQHSCSLDLKEIYDVFKPDVILIHQRKKEFWKNATKIPAPCASIMWDNHGYREERLNWINKEKIKMSLFRSKGYEHTKGGMQWWVDNLWGGHMMRYMPAACNVDVYRDYGYKREYDICLMGRAHASTYPLRHKVFDWLLNEPHKYSIFHKKRPKRSWGWTPKKRRNADVYIGEDYARAIAKCKIMPTGCSVYGYAVNKYFEPTGCGTALAANMPVSGEALGFIPDVNFIEIDANNFKDKIAYYLQNDDERKTITTNAMKLMHTRHSTKIRARELLQNLEELLDA